MIYDDLSVSLAQAAAKAPLNVDQHKALDIGREIVKAAQARLKGNTKPLMGVIERLEGRSQEAPSPTCPPPYL